MLIQTLHPWDVSPEDAAAIQRWLAAQLVLSNPLKDVRLVAGGDCSLDLERQEACAGVIVFFFPDLKPLEYVSARRPLVFPYVPGLLTFREGPALLAAFEKVTRDPDVVFFDGQGIAHPRRLGIAAHMGLLLDKPSIGCGKSKLCGAYEAPGNVRGDHSLLRHRGETIGYALTTKPGANPLFISPGHRMDLPGALDLTLRCLDGYRLPKPTRLADAYVASVKRGKEPALPGIFNSPG